MEKIEKLTAKQARAIVESKSMNIDEIMQRIKQSSEDGRVFACVGCIPTSLIEELKELGYDASLLNGGSTIIKW